MLPVTPILEPIFTFSPPFCTITSSILKFTNYSSSIKSIVQGGAIISVRRVAKIVEQQRKIVEQFCVDSTINRRREKKKKEKENPISTSMQPYRSSIFFTPVASAQKSTRPAKPLGSMTRYFLTLFFSLSLSPYLFFFFSFNKDPLSAAFTTNTRRKMKRTRATETLDDPR